MFTYITFVDLAQTDATGVLFFPRQLELALQAFEAFLRAKDFPLLSLLAGHYLFPVVHAEATYLAPICVGDKLAIELSVVSVGESSVTFAYTFTRAAVCVGKALLVHVATDRTTRASIPVPDAWRALLLKM